MNEAPAPKLLPNWKDSIDRAWEVAVSADGTVKVFVGWTLKPEQAEELASCVDAAAKWVREHT